ncbi:MAG: hypothetical protein N2Z73_00780, partial [Endomicrobia bacterium]|nr:hypothetical protein [Endomicrobiia bacterium]
SKLPLLRKKDLFRRKSLKNLIGKDTDDCIIKGVINFYISGINHLIEKLKPDRIIITGGDAEFFVRFYKNLPNITYIKNLVLLGIMLWSYSKGVISDKNIQILLKSKIFNKSIDIKKII